MHEFPLTRVLTHNIGDAVCPTARLGLEPSSGTGNFYLSVIVFLCKALSSNISKIQPTLRAYIINDISGGVSDACQEIHALPAFFNSVILHKRSEKKLKQIFLFD